jgi:hypothetical protein
MKLIALSHNNPCLCHAILKSALRSHTPHTPVVLYDADQEEAIQGYQLLQERFKKPRWVATSPQSFQQDLVAALQPADRRGNEYWVCLADDGIVFRKRLMSVNYQEALHDPNTACYSQRLSPLAVSLPLPDFHLTAFVKRHWRKWCWQTGESDFGIPFGFDGSVYRAEQLAKLVTSLPAGTPNETESALTKSPFWKSCPSMACGIEPTAIRLYNDNPAESLTAVYLSGHVLDLDPICKVVPEPAIATEFGFVQYEEESVKNSN